MHESAIAQSIVRTVLEEAGKQDAKKVESIEVEIGELTFLGIEQVEFWVKTSLEGTIAADAEIKLEKVNAEIECDECAYQGNLNVEEDPAYHITLPRFSCPSCNSPKIRIVRGKDAVIRRIRILKD